MPSGSGRSCYVTSSTHCLPLTIMLASRASGPLCVDEKIGCSQAARAAPTPALPCTASSSPRKLTGWSLIGTFAASSRSCPTSAHPRTFYPSSLSRRRRIGTPVVRCSTLLIANPTPRRRTMHEVGFSGRLQQDHPCPRVQASYLTTVGPGAKRKQGQASYACLLHDRAAGKQATWSSMS